MELFVKIVHGSRPFPIDIYLLKRNTRTRCEICSKLTIKTPKRRYKYRICYLIQFLEKFWDTPEDNLFRSFALYLWSHKDHNGRDWKLLHACFFVYVNLCLRASQVSCYYMHAKIPFVCTCTQSMYVIVVFMNAHWI